MKELNIYFRSYNELTKHELYDIYCLRQEVFIVEQNCVYQDIDKKDHHSYHLMAYDNQILVAYLRIVHPGISYSEASIGRVLTKMSHRRRGISKKIITNVESSKGIFIKINNFLLVNLSISIPDINNVITDSNE